MLEIKKRREPIELAEYRILPDASYANMHGAPTGKQTDSGQKIDVYHVVLNSLIDEQGGLCAYCMRRIPLRRGPVRATIEHILPQHSITEQEALNYRNMLAVCPGNRDAKNNEDKTCDASRGSLKPDDQIMIVNPLIKETLSTIEYLEDGTIFSKDKTVNDDLNRRLNLNCKSLLLAQCRASALAALQERVNEDNKNRKASKAYFQKLLSEYSQVRKERAPYVGILISWLEKKVQ